MLMKHVSFLRGSLLLGGLSISVAHAQTITTTALATSAVPVNSVGALLLLSFAISMCIARRLRWGWFANAKLRTWATCGAALVMSAALTWGEVARAQLAELQRFFTSPSGETLQIPVQVSALASDGSPLGYLPVVYTNQTAANLLVTNLTPATWQACFPLGVPSVPPSAALHAGERCTAGTVLAPNAQCWVEVAALCNQGASIVVGDHPSVLQADVASTTAGALATGNVLINDSDLDGALQVTRFVLQGMTYPAGATASAFTMQSDGTFSFSPSNPYLGASPLVVTYAVETGASSTLTININNLPIARNDSAITNESAAITIAVRSNDTDADGDSLTVASVTQGANGSVVIDPVTGNPIYTPNAGFVGSDSFTYTVSDGKGGTATATVNVTVNAVVPVNTPPVANNDSATTGENTAVTIAVRSNDTDANGDSLTVASVTQGANGSVVIDPVTGNPIYTPNAGFVGSDSFTYTVSDGKGGTATATVNVTVNAVVPVNTPPVANDDSVSTGANVPIVIPEATLLANDTDADANPLTLQSVQAAINGTVSRAAGNVTFTPSSGFEGRASFTYTITDGIATSTATVTVTVGSASAPSVVVLKSLLVLAQGTGGASVRFPIITALVDTDGSESLSIRISGVPTGLTFNAGTNVGGGVWQLASSDLANLMLSVPGSYTTLATNMTVQVIATESNGGATASASAIVTLKAAYTTVDFTTTESGNFTGSSANEFIQGGNGNNTINANSGNNIVHGGGGNDNLSAAAGSDLLDGGSGNDILDGGSGTDVLIGGPGDDTMTGGAAGENFVDVFVWQLGDQGAAGTPAIDTINNFSTAAAGSGSAGGDVLYLRDLLQGETVGPSNSAGNLANYLHFEISGSNTIIHISHTGGFAADSHVVGASYASSSETQQIVLVGVNLQSLYSGATTDQQIITQLLNNNKLIVH